MALEGNEVEGKVGEFGGYAVDISDKGILKASMSVEIDLLAELEKLALKSNTKLDDSFIAVVKQIMGR